MTSPLSFRTPFIITLLLGALITLSPFTTSAASVLKVTQITQPASVVDTEDVTVNLYCQIKTSKKTYSTSGTGVLISEKGVILTNAHVAQFFLLQGESGRVKGSCTVRTGSPAKDAYTASVLYFPSIWIEENVTQISKVTAKGTGEQDFALLYITGAKKGILPTTFPYLSVDTARTAVLNESVTIGGYPTEDLNFKEIQKKLQQVVATSTVTNLRGFTNDQPADIITLSASKAGAFGSSGGPVVDNTNKVIGIVATKSTNTSDRTLRAISLPYISRMIQAQTAYSLDTLIAGDLATRALVTKATLSEDLINSLKTGLLKK